MRRQFIMKLLLILTVALFVIKPFTSQAVAQCTVQTINRDDGMTVRYLSPERVGYSDELLLMLSMQTVGETYNICVVSIFEKEALKLKGNLSIKFNDNSLSVFKHYTSIFTTFNGLPATLSIFVVDNKSDLLNIAHSEINFIGVQLENGVYQAIKPKMNANVLRKQYNCLN
ncbi:MAG: hypothetical protein KDB92_08945 [Chitinophagaceae bacterium]|nr:hypothetical protein [Chitinophagaceae bacterium]